MRISPPPRRRTSVVPKLFIALLLLFLGLLVWLGLRDTQVPTQHIEQDVTNEALAG
jgi:hypothetical protein